MRLCLTNHYIYFRINLTDRHDSLVENVKRAIDAVMAKISLEEYTEGNKELKAASKYWSN